MAKYSRGKFQTVGARKVNLSGLKIVNLARSMRL